MAAHGTWHLAQHQWAFKDSQENADSVAVVVKQITETHELLNYLKSLQVLKPAANHESMVCIVENARQLAVELEAVAGLGGYMI